MTILFQTYNPKYIRNFWSQFFIIILHQLAKSREVIPNIHFSIFSSKNTQQDIFGLKLMHFLFLHKPLNLQPKITQIKHS